MTLSVVGLKENVLIRLQFVLFTHRVEYLIPYYAPAERDHLDIFVISDFTHLYLLNEAGIFQFLTMHV